MKEERNFQPDTYFISSFCLCGTQSQVTAKYPGFFCHYSDYQQHAAHRASFHTAKVEFGGHQ